jgi:protein-S-isoprenylcysteine O-methyltransferase Ste14
MAWSSLPAPGWLRWAGLMVAFGGGCLWVWAVASLGKNLTDTVITRRDHSLVTTGPYRWVRHPFYTSCLIGLVGVSLLMTNLFVLVAGIVFWFAFLVPRTRIEEQNLVARFGDEYRQLMQRTGRFLPRIGK